MNSAMATSSISTLEMEDIQQRIRSRFARSEVRHSSTLYLKALLGPVQRKNCWQLAEASGENNPYAIQRLLCQARWSADTVRDDLRDYVMEHLGHPEAVGVIDETGFLKKGDKSAGVQRQYSGTAGKIENCQIGVFLAYSSAKGRAFLDRELYLPQQWIRDKARRKEAAIPEEVKFATKPQLALRMLQRAMEAGVSFGWITADEVYGSYWGLRRWLEEQRQPYVLAVSSQHCVWWKDLRQWRVKRLASEVAGDSWQRLSIGEGSKGPRVYDWSWVRLPDRGLTPPKGWGWWLIVRKSVEKTQEMAYFLAAGPQETSLSTLAEVAGKRWAIEMAFEEAKGEAGLDEYEVRKWDSWYRHITLSLLAHAYLAVVRSQAGKKGTPHN